MKADVYDAARITGNEADPGDVAPLTTGEVLARVERRLAWYGLKESALSAVRVLDRARVVVTLTVGGRNSYCEVLDRWTGAVRYREVLPFGA